MGKSLQQLNAIAVRQPANTPATAGSNATSGAPNEPVTAESLGWQLRAALPPLRLHSVSLYDEEANVLWLSEGALGPDEHNVVMEAIEALGSDTTLTVYETGLEDGRVAIFLPVRSPVGGLVGLAMILADIKSVSDGVVERLVTPAVRTIMQKLAVLLRPAQPRSGQTESVKILELAPEPAPAVAVVEPAAKSAGAPLSHAPSAPVARPAINGAARPAPASAPASAGMTVLSPQAVDDILEFELTPDLPKISPSVSVTAAPVAKAVPTPPVAKRTPKSAPVSNASSVPASSVVAAAPALTAAPVAAAPIVTAAPAPAAPIVAIEDDLRLPTLEAREGARSANNVAPFPTPPTVAAASPTAEPTVAVPPVAAPAAVAASTVAAAPVAVAAVTAAPAVAPQAMTAGTTITNPALTGTSRTITSSTGTAKSLSATSTSRVLTLPEGMSLLLEVQPFSKLRAGGRTRRFEVLPRSTQPNRVPAGFDKITLQHLLTWMESNRGAWNLEPTSFTLNLSIATLEDERFPQFVASNLKTHGIAPDNIGFEIAEPLCLQRRAQVERFITLCDKLGCFVIIDDFSLDSSVMSLLRSKALRMVKIDPKLTSVALKDKLAQAMVVAIAQAVKVLGIHCAAKRVESQASLQWLTAIGCDFAQGPALSQVHAIEQLGMPPAPA